jgi:thiol-disulfide isomerase/thioredoxin
MRLVVLTVMAALAQIAAPAGARPVQGLVVHAAPVPVPALDIRDADGRPAGLDALRGQVVVLNLWASWCMPCVAELPALDRLKPRIEPKGVAVVALSLDRGGKATVVNTYARLGITSLAIRTDEARAAAEKLAAPVLPITLLIGRDGNEVARFVGPAAWDGPEAAALLEAIAAGRTPTADMAPPPAKSGPPP